jgi:hypothetical protein
VSIRVLKNLFMKGLITAYLELPFWIRITDNFGLVYDEGHELIVRNNFWKMWIYEIRNDCKTLLYIGPREFFYKDNLESLSKELKERIQKREIPALWQRCRTVIEIKWRDKNFSEELRKGNNFKIKKYIFQVLLPHVNEFIERYRMLTFDQMVYRISQWDVPTVFFKINNEPAYSINTYDYLSWNQIPMVGEYGKPNTLKLFYLISEPEKIWKNYEKFPYWAPYERELLDAYNSKIRGDYETAIRRAVTAFEILLDKKIKDSLLKKGKTETEAEEEIEKNYIWPRKKELFYRTIGKRLEDILSPDLLKIVEDARKIRHEIVHKGKKILPSERGKARYFLDHLRFAINLLEENQEHSLKRDKLLLRSNIESVDFLDQ